MATPPDLETLTHRLVLPRDANHHGTLYAGVLLALALEAGYATAYRAAGASANLVLKRVLDLRCYEPLPLRVRFGASFWAGSSRSGDARSIGPPRRWSLPCSAPPCPAAPVPGWTA